MSKNRIGFGTNLTLVNSRVGIGTTNPLNDFNVFGNVLISAGAATTQHITIRPYTVNNGTLSFEGSAGQLFSVTNNLTSGSIFSVNDVSGIPSIDVNADGTITLGVYGGNIGVGTTRPVSKLDVVGNARVTGVVTATAFSGDVYNAYPFYSGITSSVYASPTGVLAPIISFPSTSNRRYVIHSINVANRARRQPTGAGATVGINTLAGAVTSVTINAVGTGYTAGDIGSPTNLNVSFATTSFVGVGTTGDPAFAGITSALGYITSVAGGRPTGVAVTFGGFGYTAPPTVTFAAPLAGGTRETGTAVVTYGEVTGVFLNTPGEGYTTPPSVSIASTTGIGATITADVDSDGRVIRLNLLSRGYGYSKLNALGNNEENEVYISLPGLARTEVAVDVAIDRVPVGGGTTVQSYLAFSTPIPPGGVVEILKQPAVLNPSDQIEIRGVDVNGSGLSNAIDVCISYEETTNTNFIGYGTATGANSGLGTAINNIGILSATTNPIMIQSIRLTNTEFVGDYDVSVDVVRPNSLTYNASVNSTVAAGSTIIFVDNLTNNSLETVVRAGNLISVSPISSASITSVGNTFVTIGTASTVASAINVGTAVTFTVDRVTFLARNLIVPAFASIELCDTPKRLEPGTMLMMDANTVGIDTNLAQTIDIQVSGRNITL